VDKRHKDILRPLVTGLRRTLVGAADGSVRGDLDRELERLGIAPDGTIVPFDTVPNPTPVERRARRVAEAELAPVPAAERKAARAAFVERAAYGWFNRLLALRVLEARGLIDPTLRADPAYGGLSEALSLLRQDEPARASGPDGGWWAVVEDACAAQAESLPGLFALDARMAGSSATLFDLAVALRPSTTVLLECVRKLGDPATVKGARTKLTPPGSAGVSPVPSSPVPRLFGVSPVPASPGSAGVPPVPASPVPASPTIATDSDPEALFDAVFADPDAIGWAYQFYQEEPKTRTYGKLKGGGKVATRDEIAAVTQLFTEPYMVQWLLQNSLGRSYHEAYPSSKLPASWAYYIRPETLDAPSVAALDDLTVLDPCVGSAHFLREAFDMLAAMYREQRPDQDATAVADRILGHHLHGVDLDPRAAQLAAFTLYARAWENVRDERRARRLPGPGDYRPVAMNLATTPGRVAPGALERHLQRHPADRLLEPLLRGAFAALEQADVLGSLLQPREHLAAAVAELRHPHTRRMQFDPDLDAFSRAVEEMAQADPAGLEAHLLDRVAESFTADAQGADDVAAQLFGGAAERGVRLLQLLDRRYAVVVTNPPYMGSASIDKVLRGYVEKNYTAGKWDLYSAFILRCLQLCDQLGRVAMVTKQGWLLDHEYADFRAVPEDELQKAQEAGLAKSGRGADILGARASRPSLSSTGVSEQRGERPALPSRQYIDPREEGRFRGILRETQFDLLVQLDAGAFEEITGEVVKAALFLLRVAAPPAAQTLRAINLSGLKSAAEKAAVLSQSSPARLKSLTYFAAITPLLRIESSPVLYWMPQAFQQLFSSNETLGHSDTPLLAVKDGMNTGDNERFVRFVWEGYGPCWAAYSKGGGYSKWLGLEYYLVDWGHSGERIASAKLLGTRLQNIDTFFVPALCYSRMSQGSLAVRFSNNCVYDGTGLSVQVSGQIRLVTAALSIFALFVCLPHVVVHQAPKPQHIERRGRFT